MKVEVLPLGTGTIDALYSKVKKIPKKPIRNQTVVQAELHPTPWTRDPLGMNQDPDNFITVIPIDYQNQNLNTSGTGSGGGTGGGNTTQQAQQHRNQPRRANVQKTGQSGHRKKTKMRSDMDPDYRYSKKISVCLRS